MKNKGITVLSLFDGMSCGQIALERAGVKVDKYFASEIDKYAIKIAQKNYPNTIQLGDIIKISGKDLPKIDLVMGGSPCQGFSLAGNRLNFNDPRSKLFFEFKRLLEECNPKYFLLENVKMKREWADIITRFLGVEPIEINSALVSAQRRIRLYWTNIDNITQPKDKGILLKDIIEDGEVERNKSYCIDANYYKGGSLKKYLEKKQGRSSEPLRQSEKRLMVKTIPHGFVKEKEEEKDKYPTLTAQNPGSKHLIQVGEADIKGYDLIRRVYSVEGKSPTLTTMQGGHREPKIAINNEEWRKLTPIECERLQTLKDNYTEGVSNTQRYKMIGNGWTVDVIAHIFTFMDL